VLHLPAAAAAGGVLVDVTRFSADIRTERLLMPPASEAASDFYVVVVLDFARQGRRKGHIIAPRRVAHLLSPRRCSLVGERILPYILYCD